MGLPIDGLASYKLRRELIEILNQSLIKHGKVGNRTTDQILRSFERGPNRETGGKEE